MNFKMPIFALLIGLFLPPQTSYAASAIDAYWARQEAKALWNSEAQVKRRHLEWETKQEAEKLLEASGCLNPSLGNFNGHFRGTFSLQYNKAENEYVFRNGEYGNPIFDRLTITTLRQQTDRFSTLELNAGAQVFVDTAQTSSGWFSGDVTSFVMMVEGRSYKLTCPTSECDYQISYMIERRQSCD